MKLIGTKVAKTRSGANIYTDGSVNIRLPSLDDLFDAYAVFEFLCIREYIRFGENETFYNFYEKSKDFKKKLGIKNIEKIKLKLGITDAFSLRDFGQKLVLTGFKNLSRAKNY